MSYLLSNGIITDRMDIYIKDMIQLNFNIYPSDIPYNDQLGITRRFNTVSKSEFTDNVRKNLDDFIAKLNVRHNLEMKVTNVEFNKDSIDVDIRLSPSEIISYAMPVTH
jgi:hypothetical protein